MLGSIQEGLKDNERLSAYSLLGAVRMVERMIKELEITHKILCFRLFIQR